jgi:mitogen-activated protein kinase kinase
VNGTTNEASNQSGSETPLFESYYGGPSGPALKLNTDSPDDMTIRPPIRVTTIPQKSSDPLDDLHRTMGDLELNATPPVRPQTEETTAPFTPSQWTDDVLEEISRLGEGAGGAVHKVRDKRNDTIMARKTITTREAPMKQLLRELAIISSTQHVNIIQFYGAYMSPSSSEVKILMEFSEGGSLEAVGKRIKDRGAVVGEKTAGRLAEGVSLMPFIFTMLF